MSLVSLAGGLLPSMQGRPAVQLIDATSAITVHQVSLATCSSCLSDLVQALSSGLAQVWLGADAGLGYSAADPIMAHSFWNAQSQHVLTVVKAHGLGCILVCASCTSSTSTLVTVLVALGRSSEWLRVMPGCCCLACTFRL